MSDYTPDRWLVVKITTDKEMLYKVFACWYGGLGGSDSWQFNSGIVKVELADNYYEFHGHSGSVYRCHKNCYGTHVAEAVAAIQVTHIHRNVRRVHGK